MRMRLVLFSVVAVAAAVMIALMSDRPDAVEFAGPELSAREVLPPMLSEHAEPDADGVSNTPASGLGRNIPSPAETETTTDDIRRALGSHWNSLGIQEYFRWLHTVIDHDEVQFGTDTEALELVGGLASSIVAEIPEISVEFVRCVASACEIVVISQEPQSHPAHAVRQLLAALHGPLVAHEFGHLTTQAAGRMPTLDEYSAVYVVRPDIARHLPEGH